MKAVLLTPFVNNDIMLELTVRKGKSQLRSVMAYFKEAYPSRVSTASSTVSLDPGTIFWGVSTNCLVINTDHPVKVNIIKGDGTSYDVRVNKLFVLDDDIGAFNVVNDGASIATLTLCYSHGTVDMSARGVLSVNDNLPDASGNVEVDTGVMTVNGQPPVDGNVDIVEEAPNDGEAYLREGRSWKDLNESTDEGEY